MEGRENIVKKLYKRNLIETKKKIREYVTKDLLIIQTISNIEDLDKVINILVTGLREWYELYLPEFSKNTPDHEKFVDDILKYDKNELLKKINLEKEESMGADLGKEDLKPILGLGKRIKKLYTLKEEQEKHLQKIMDETCPKLTRVAGSSIGAKLIELAGSLKHLAELPSSTIQLLGAEKALFRHLRNKKYLSPKYGVIMAHQDVQTSEKGEWGKASRKLAAKISIAVKVDYFGKR